MKSQQIRQQFLDFFESKKHNIVSSSPMVLKNDPTLMFTNAGMVPFKEYFLGQKNATDKQIWEEIEKPINKLGCKLHSVKIKETEKNYVEYFGKQ